jgi:uncharacterized protein YneF (UPF0154 family)
MSAEDIVIPIVAMTTICTTVFGLYYLRNRENMALIEKGMNPRNASPEEPRRFSALRYGLMFTGGGMGLAIAFLIEWAIAKVHIEKVPFINEQGIREMNTIAIREDFPQLYFAFIILGAGLGLVSAYLIIRKDMKKE